MRKIVFVFITGVFLWSCTEQGKQETENIAQLTNNTPIELRAQMDSLFNAYLQLSNDLVAGDNAKAANSAFAINKQLYDIQAASMAGKYQTYWQQEGPGLVKLIDAISLATTIEKQREIYRTFSTALLAVFKEFGFTDRKVYAMHCPMAFNNTGASWLSDTSLVLNPYFGDVMLHCGEVTEVYAFKKAE